MVVKVKRRKQTVAIQPQQQWVPIVTNWKSCYDRSLSRNQAGWLSNLATQASKSSRSVSSQVIENCPRSVRLTSKNWHLQWAHQKLKRNGKNVLLLSCDTSTDFTPLSSVRCFIRMHGNYSRRQFFQHSAPTSVSIWSLLDCLLNTQQSLTWLLPYRKRSKR